MPGIRDDMPVEHRAAMRRTRGSGLAQQSSAPNPSVMQCVFQSSDMTSHIFQILPASMLLQCTLVCCSFRTTIDTSVTGEFERHLRWTCFFMEKWAASDRAVCGVDFNTKHSVLFANVHVAQQAVQHMLQLNVIPKVENYVHLNMPMYLPLAHVNVDGDVKHIERLEAQGDVSIDVRKWQIVEIEKDHGRTRAISGSIGWLQLKAVLFTHNSPLKLQVDHGILVRSVEDTKLSTNKQHSLSDFHKVPVDPPVFNYRSLCVVRCVLVCMHCHQLSDDCPFIDDHP